WKRKVRLGRESGESLDDGLYHELRYEDLVRDPDRGCTTACSFLRLPYDEVMVRSYEEQARERSNAYPKHPWYPITTAALKWREDMKEPDIELFEAAAGDLLDELGYERAFPRPRAEALDTASRLLALFTQSVRARGERLPSRWDEPQ